MVMTRSYDGTRGNLGVPILHLIEQTAPTARSTKGSRATIRVLYPGYRGTSVMAQPRNPARDTPRLPRATPGGFHYWNYRYMYGQLSTKYPSPGSSHPLERHHRRLQRQDNTMPGRTDSKSISSQVKPEAHDTDFKNLLESHPPQHQE
jgi:hypothetical protein